MIAFALLAGALLLGVPSVGEAPPPDPAGTTWLLVQPDGSVHPHAGSLDAIPAADRAELRGVWGWSRTSAPRHFDAAQVAGEVPHLPTDPDRLAVRVEGVLRRDLPALRVLAAPATMWGEVPESLIPRWKVGADGRLSLPHVDGEAWRLRVIGGGLGTWWRELPPGTRQVELFPRDAEPLRLLVVGPDGTPVPAARVQAVEARGERLGRGVDHALERTDADGQLVFQELEPVAALRLLVLAPGFVPASLRGAPDALPRRLVLEAGAAVHGRVIDGEGRPVPGVTVVLESRPTSFPALWRQLGESGDDGSWALDGAAPGEAVLTLRGEGWATSLQHLDLEAGPVDLGDLPLEAATTALLRVVDDLGQPVAGATVRPLGGDPQLSDKAGVAHLDDVPPRRSREVMVNAPDHLPTRHTLRPPHDAEDAVVLQRAFVVTGRVVDETGAPLPSAHLRLVDCNDSEQPSVAADGSFRLALVADRELELVAGAPTKDARHETLAPGTAGETRDLGDLSLSAGRLVRGRLLRADDRAPVAGATIWTPRDPADPLTSWFRRDVLSTRSDAEGVFELRGLGPQPSTLRVEAGGLAELRVPVSFPAQATEIDLEDVEVPVGVDLEVHAAGFDPASAVARADLGGRWLEPDMVEAPFVDGIARFSHLPTGVLRITAVRDRALLCEEEVHMVPRSSHVEVTCAARRMTVHGRVVVAQRSAGAGLLSWLPADAGSEIGVLLRQRSASGLQRSTAYGVGRPQVDVEVDDDGTFSSDELRPGAWRVVWLPGAGGSTPTVRIDLPDVDEHALVVELPGLALSGEVLDEDGRPVANARVRLLDGGALTFTGIGGRFEILGVEPGPHYLRAEHDGRSSSAVAVHLEAERPAPPTVLRLGEDEDSPEISIQILNAADGAAPGALVVADLEERGQRLLTANDSGRARLAVDPPWPRRIRTAAWTAAGWALGGWTDWQTAVEEGVALQVGALGALRHDGSAPAIQALISTEGWDLWWLLARLGRRPVADAEGCILLTGLPAGVYTVRTDSGSRSVDVRENRVSEIGAALP